MPAARDVVEVDGIQVNITRAPGKPLILLTRMASADMGIWDTIWDDFARYFTVANFDLSQLPAARHLDDPGRSFRQLARHTADVASGLGFERFHVFGWNGGTLIALACAMDHADRVASCLLLDPFYELADMRHVNKAVQFKRALFENPNRELYAYYWVMAGLTSDFIENNFDTVERLVAARLEKDRFVKVDVERFEKWVRALRTNWFDDADCARITAPTLIAATELDRWNAGPSVAMAREVKKRIAGSDLTIIENAGGHFLLEDPGRFMAVVEPFLKRVTTR